MARLEQLVLSFCLYLQKSFCSKNISDNEAGSVISNEQFCSISKVFLSDLSSNLFRANLFQFEKLVTNKLVCWENQVNLVNWENLAKLVNCVNPLPELVRDAFRKKRD